MTKREEAVEEMLACLAEVCPSCGDPILGAMDAYGDELSCPPCCDFGAEILEENHFWEGLGHRERVALIQAALGVSPRELLHVEDDGSWRLLADLEVRLEKYKGARKAMFAFVGTHHRHHEPPAADKFRLAAYAGGERVGVAIVGRPVSRVLDDGSRLEVTRVATIESYKAHHAASALYGAAAREAQRLGYRIIQTYILETETGTSLKAAGFVPVFKSKGGSWNARSRPRKDKAPTCPKVRYERLLADRSAGGDRGRRAAGVADARGSAPQPADRP